MEKNSAQVHAETFEESKENLDNLQEVTIKSFTGHENDVSCCAFTSDWKLLVTGADDYTLRLWDMTLNSCIRTMVAHTQSVKSVTFDFTNNKIASGGADGIVYVWDVRTGIILNCLKGHMMSVECVAFSRSSDFLCSGSWDYTAILWQLKSGCPLRILDDHTSVVSCCNFSCTGNMLATASWDYTINLYNISEYIEMDKERSTSRLSLTPISGMSQRASSALPSEINRDVSRSSSTTPELNSRSSFSDTSLDKSALSDTPVQGTTPSENVYSFSQILKHDMSHKNNSKVFKYHKGNIKAVVFSCHDLLASASWDCTVCLWDTYTGQCLHILDGHNGFVQACAFSIDGLYLASAADDETVRVWSVESGELIKALDAYTDEIHQLSFTQTGSLLTSGPKEVSLCMY